jgi:hypothetical protein
MKHTSILIAFVVALVLPGVAAGQQVGDNATIIVPAGKIVDLRQVVVVKGAPKPTATDVGTCSDAAVRLQDAQVVDREPPAGRSGRGAAVGPLPTVATQTAIVVPGVTGFTELKPGWHLGSFRPGGKCGPGYDIYLAHIIAIDDKAER